jgi:hypothetical protein
MLQVLNRLLAAHEWWLAGWGRWNVAASAQLRETAQGGSEMDEVVDAGIQQVAGPSAPYGDSWDNQRVEEGTVVDGAGLVHEVAEQYRERGQAGVVTDRWEAEGRHSRGVHARRQT